MAAIGIRRELKGASFESTLARLPDALKEQGFGVLTEIDLQDTLRKKLGVEMKRYRILGACNPMYAQRALTVRKDVGVMLPCNVVVYEEDGATVVTAIDPLQTIAAAGDPRLADVAADVRRALEAALDRL